MGSGVVAWTNSDGEIGIHYRYIPEVDRRPFEQWLTERLERSLAGRRQKGHRRPAPETSIEIVPHLEPRKPEAQVLMPNAGGVSSVFRCAEAPLSLTSTIRTTAERCDHTAH
jgi:hypothetical protein